MWTSRIRPSAQVDFVLMILRLGSTFLDKLLFLFLLYCSEKLLATFEKSAHLTNTLHVSPTLFFVSFPELGQFKMASAALIADVYDVKDEIGK